MNGESRTAGSMTASVTTRTSVYAVCLHRGEILLVHQVADGPAKDHWTLPGGGIEFGEHPADAVLRECREEVGLQPDLGQVLGVHSDTYLTRDGLRCHGIRLLYEASFEGTRPDPVCPSDDEIDAVGWFPCHDLPEPTTAWVRRGVDLATDRLHTSRAAHFARPYRRSKRSRFEPNP